MKRVSNVNHRTPRRLLKQQTPSITNSIQSLHSPELQPFSQTQSQSWIPTPSTCTVKPTPANHTQTPRVHRLDTQKHNRTIPSVYTPLLSGTHTRTRARMIRQASIMQARRPSCESAPRAAFVPSIDGTRANSGPATRLYTAPGARGRAPLI